ncbi:hypothetical protein [Sphingobacterium sp. LRF_L2]|uniref:hypothetical protein n=1 Tax=Sphingobacterium sp. LRF_L2 TaxID=3369421 RepID=UPI003F607A7A
MIKFGSAAVLVALLTSCKDTRYQKVEKYWAQDSVAMRDSAKDQSYFDEVHSEKARLHGKEVRVRGRLVYEYDDSAIYPFNDESEFKPIWIHIENDDQDLHSFLLSNDQGLVTVVGVLDTLAYYDKRQYGSALKDVTLVSVTHVLPE